MTAYYNDNDPKVCDWLEVLVEDGLIAPGVVDRRSILDVEPSDLRGFTQCHFFAGIGGWSYALRLAGWPDDRPVWTGSAPCQPFSVAGAGLARDDPRHLAPTWLRLIEACRPPVLFGEQVASADVFGKAAKSARSEPEGTPEWAWIDDVQAHMEAAHYAFGVSDLPAAGVGAPHLRQRCFFGAYDLGLAEGTVEYSALNGREQRRAEPEGRGVVGGCSARDVAEPDGRQRDRLAEHGEHEPDGEASGRVEGDGEPAGDRGAQRVADQHDTGPQGRPVLPQCGDQRPAGPGSVAVGQPAAGPVNGFWRDADWLFCTDDKWRAVEPGTFPLAHGVPGRVALLRGAGNAIVPEIAAEFIGAFTDAITR